MLKRKRIIAAKAAASKRRATPSNTIAPVGAIHWLSVYTDGNHFKSRPRNGVDGSALGYGIYAKHHDKEYGFSTRVDTDYMERFFGMDRKISKGISNPTMELCAVVHTLMLVSGTHRSDAPRIINIYTDCTGPENWLQGRWAARKPYIKHLVDMGKRHLRVANERNVFIKFIHVTGHSGNTGNNKADALSKGENGAMTCMLDFALLFG